ncbi:hypothetical protein SCP_1004060 [Sparassis crispa]|uniref:CCHC-type domain-containing protein n=1 Tax=Sparassis crispa TaxID=139825 RepID=A0A401GYC1_9APHY|nr:hypothetical protein SCP_1004060 [Sparassis crispa]GBE87159.1 hypothetical protein SCP_1004060 [Sparassis crispa]
MSTSADNTSNSNAYRIPLLKEDNWLPWKRRVEAILNDKGLQEYVTGKTLKPQPSNDPANRAAREAEISAWGEKDLKAQNVIVLSLGDSQMVHIAGAKTAWAMWEQLRTVKEQRGQHGILALCWRFYRMQAKEEDNISSHITQLRQIQEQLHLMRKVVSDEDFRLILATSLLESWDSFLSSYFGAEGADNVHPQLTSQELIAIILDENRRRHERGERGQSSDQAMVAKGKKRPFGEYKKCSICGKPRHLGNECRHRDKVKCMNCGKFGHKATDCWAKGGGKAGQGPPMKQQKTECAYEAHEVESKEDEAKIAYDNDSDTVSLGSDGKIASFYEWFADSGTTSHITNRREVFTTYQALEDHAITGIGPQPMQALGRSTVDVKSEVGDRKVKFRLHGVLYALTAPNSLLSIMHLDDAGGRVLMEADEDLDNDPDKSNAKLVYIAMSAHGNADADEPKTLSDAKRSLEWPKWEQAVQTELNQLQGMETWELVEPPEDRKPIGNKWVLVKKTNKEGEIIKYKARLVAKGYSQIPGMDYTETFAPVVHLETIRAILGLAAILDWEIGQMDVKGAYLNGTLKEEVYMRQPKGYNDGTYRVCKLKKTLYRLKQSGREWNIVLNRKLLDAGFKHLFSDPCVYIRIKGDKIEIVTVWVDDLLIFTNDCALMDQLKRELRNMFEVTDLGEPQKIVGIEIERDRSKQTIKISQTKYIESILHKNGLTNANTVGMPLDPNTVLEKEEPETDDECDRDNGYASLIGSLMYTAIAMRPDIAHTVQRLSSFTANPGMAHWTAAKCVLRYLSGMRELGIIYGPIADVKPKDQSIFVGYSDADYANDIRDRKSISGYLFKLGNGMITWSSKKQTTVASSTTEAEYMASAEAAKEAMWLQTLFKEIGFEQQDPTILFEDNTVAISIARDPQFHAKSKHFDVKHHYVCEKLRDKYIDIHYCPTEDMIADILTKSLPKPRHEKLTKKLGMPIGLRGSVEK